VLKLSDFAAVIFDMDGLVLDTEPTYFIAWQRAAKAMGYTLSDAFFRSLSGLHYQAVEQKLRTECGADFDLQTFNRLSGACWHEHVNAHGINTRPGFTELLAFIIELKIPYCLATNSSSVNAGVCLELAGIADVFATVISRDDVPCGKPEPDIFLKAASVLDVPIGRCLVLEDSHAGIVAASRAGAYSVLVPSTAPVEPLAVALCDLMAADLAQLIAR
jgi:HAD superfamily hydrolase (TIGR01509 family)